MRGCALAILAAGAVVACSDAAGPVPSLAGLWYIVAYESDGVAATTVSGTVDFSDAGTVTFHALLTFPGEPQDTVESTATWTQTGTQLVLTDSVDTSEWTLGFTDGGGQVVLALLHDASASRLTLARPAR